MKAPALHIQGKLEGQKIDWKGVLSDFAAEKDDILNMPGRKEITENIKFMNLALKAFDYYLVTLKARFSDTAEFAALEAARDSAKGVRNALRLQVAVRRVVSIIDRQAVDEVDGLLADLKLCNVSLPKQLRELLPKKTT